MYINNCTNTISCFYEVEPNIYGQCKVKMFPYKIIGRNVKSEIMLSPKMAPHLHLTSVCKPGTSDWSSSAPLYNRYSEIKFENLCN